MKALLPCALVGLLLVGGCKSGDSTAPKTQPGAGPTDAEPSRFTPATKPAKPRPKARPDVDIEPTPLVLKKGEKKKWQINIKRSGDYDKEFSIMLNSDDAGIKVPDEVKVPGSKDEKQTIEIEVSAGKDAKSAGITLIATPPGLEDPKAAMVKVMVDK